MLGEVVANETTGKNILEVILNKAIEKIIFICKFAPFGEDRCMSLDNVLLSLMYILEVPFISLRGEI